MIKDYYSEELLNACNNTYFMLDENLNIVAIDKKDLPEDFDYSEYVKAIFEWMPD